MFKARCLEMIDRLSKDRQPAAGAKRGEPVAIPAAAGTAPSPFGAMRGSVLGYDKPFEPAADPSDWNAVR